MNRVGILALCLVVAAASAAPGAVLFERSITVDRSANVFTSTRFDLDLNALESFFSATPAATLFDAVEITPDDVGATFSATATSDPGFAAFVARLADSQDEILRVLFAELISGRAEQRGFPESGFFVTAGRAVDFAQATIEEIRLRVDRFSLVFDTQPLAASAGPPVDLGLTLTVLGQGVPEPAGLSLLAVAAGVSIVAARRQPRLRRRR
ncbi:MAG: hypothetical protein KDA44_12735 [Planctomycetales bacterium]|nr:hypothetical protein [Planctomycetales bacterium]